MEIKDNRDVNIYIIKSPNIKKVYIGSSVNPKRRYSHHKSKTWRSGLSSAKEIIDSGDSYFEILDTCSEADRTRIESDYISQYGCLATNTHLKGRDYKCMCESEVCENYKPKGVKLVPREKIIEKACKRNSKIKCML